MNPTLKKVLNISSLVLAAFFVAPTVVILASWNALPGDALYSTKRNLENLALRFTAGSYSTNSSLQSELLARRADEAIVLALERSSIAGLDDLKTQAQILRAQVAAAPTQAEKQAVTKKALSKLQESKTKLAQTHVTLAQGPSTTIIRETTVREQIIHYIPIIIQPTPTPTPPPTTDDIIDEITDTEEEIDEVIDDLTSPGGFAAPAAAPPASPNPSPQSGRSNPFNNSQNPLGGGPPQNQGPSPTTATASGSSN